MSTFINTGTNSPQIAVEIDFATDPTATPRTWTDVTPYVRQIQWERGGRTHELQTTSAGTLTAVLNNRDARFDPLNTAGAYYPDVKRMRWIRVLAKWSTVEYPRWMGLIETWTQDWPSLGKDATVTIRAADPFKILSLYDLVGKSYPEEKTDDRVWRVCVDADIPVLIPTAGLTTLPAVGPFTGGSSALAHLQQALESENGLMFADAEGNIVFQDRHYRPRESSTAVDTIGDIAGEIPYRDSTLDYDDANVWPTVTVTPAGGVAQTASDATSQALHFDRVLQRSSLCADVTEALAAAQYLSYIYADPSPRISTLEIIGQTATTKWPTILNMELSQRFTFKRRATASITQDVMIEGISEQAVPGSGWRVFLQLSPADTSSYWLLSNGILYTAESVLGTTTKLAY